MSSLGYDNLINCQVAFVGCTVILACEVLLSHRFGISLRISSCTCWSTWRCVGVLLA